MCLGIPGEVISVDDSAALRFGVVDFVGTRRDVCLAYVPEATVGDYVVVHVGFALTVIDREAAAQTYALLAEMDLLDELDASSTPPQVAAPEHRLAP